MNTIARLRPENQHLVAPTLSNAAVGAVRSLPRASAADVAAAGGRKTEEMLVTSYRHVDTETIKNGVLPHSAEVIAPQTPPPALPGDPAIPRAFTLKLAQGLPSEATDDMRFAAQPAGDYMIVCGMPGHGPAGMWIRLRVSGTAKTPELQPTAAPGSR
jgi:hypothetical protein